MEELRYHHYRGSFRLLVEARLLPFYKFLARILEFSRNYFVLDLRASSPQLWSVRIVDEEQYRDTQIFGNLRKLMTNYSDDSEWNMKLGEVRKDIIRRFMGRTSLSGMCLGARNGAEVRWLTHSLASEFKQLTVVGTDISDTALKFPQMIVHDFHDPLPENLLGQDFLYSNSLDQSQYPQRALQNWIHALADHGALYLWSTRAHGKSGQSKLDPFALETELLPFVLLQWFSGKAYVERILAADTSEPGNVVFVVRKIV
jgi:hypothetical protein